MPRATGKTRSEGARAAREEVRRLLRERTPEAVNVLAQIMNDKDQKPELRMKAAESILDRACGKATTAAPEAESGNGVETVRFEGVLDEWSQ